MQLGCNYSKPLMQLLDKNRVDVDWIKTGILRTLEEDLRETRPKRPVLIHNLPYLGATSIEIERYPWAFMAEKLQEAGSPHTAAHVEIRPQGLAARCGSEVPGPFCDSRRGRPVRPERSYDG